MANRIQLRRDTAANWAATDPILGQGEPGIDLTNGVFKLGDGVTPWSTLASNNDAAIATAVAGLVDSAPGALDTLNELAAALGDDPAFATTVNAAIAARATQVGLDAETAARIAADDLRVLVTAYNADQTTVNGTIDKLAIDVETRRINIALSPFFAPLDGSSHPLSERFTTLAAAQAVFPIATALTQEQDTVATNQAIAWAGETVGLRKYPTEIYVPRVGISEGIVINKDHITLSGNGPSSGFILKAPMASATTDVVTVKKSGLAIITGVTIKNMLLDGNKVAIAKSGDAENEIINGEMTINLTVEGCLIRNGQSDGIDLDGANPGVRILNNTFEGMQRTGVHLYGPYNGLVQGNTFKNCGMEWTPGVSVSAAPGSIDVVYDQSAAALAAVPNIGLPATGVRIIANVVADSLMGINLNAKRPIIASNYFYNIIGAASANVGHAICILSLTTEPTVIGNVIDTCLLDGVFSPAGPINGNTIKSPGRFGINLQSAGGVVSDNVIISSGNHGVRVPIAAPGALVQGNHITTPGGTGVIIDAIDCMVRGNIVDTPAVSGISTVSADTIIANNRVKGGVNGIWANTSAATDTLIDGNRVTGCSDHGILAQATVRTSLRNNTVRSCTTTNKSGISINASNGSVVMGNHVTGNYWGILVAALTVNHTVVENMCLGNTNTDMFVSGSVGAGGLITRNRNATGYISRTSGSTTILSGATTSVVAHGLSATPTLQQLNVTTDSLGSATKVWVSTITATQFTVNLDVAPGSTVNIGWSADVAG